MEETVQTQKEISLMDIVKLLWSKLKILIIVVLAAVVVGGSFGVLSTYNKKYYGSSLQFYVNPRLDKDSVGESESEYGVYGAYGVNVMEGLVFLLSSEFFAENLMLDNNGLPSESLVQSINDADLTTKVAAAKVAKTEADEAVKTAEDANAALTEANTLYKETAATLTSLWSTYREAHLGENISLKPSRFNDDVLTLEEEEINEAYDDNELAKTDFENKKAAAAAANKTAQNKLENAEEITEDALEIWRDKDESYYAKINAIVSSVHFSYYDESQEVNTNNIARSFIYVKISVLNGEAFAQWLRARLIDIVPQFIEENMPIPSGYDGTNCKRISRNDFIDRTNKNIVLTTAVKYAVLLAALAFIVACVVIVVIDRSDKRLRNVDQITDTFNVPVLGVIPSILPKNTQDNKTTEDKK